MASSSTNTSKYTTLPPSSAEELYQFSQMKTEKKEACFKGHRWRLNPNSLLKTLESKSFSKTTQKLLWAYLDLGEKLSLKQAKRGIEWLKLRSKELKAWENTQLTAVEEALGALEKSKAEPAKQTGKYWISEGMRQQWALNLLTLVKTLKTRLKARNTLPSVSKDLSRLELGLRLLGSGSYAQVYPGKFEGRPVAVKRRIASSDKEIGCLYYETALLEKLQGHRNIIRLLAKGDYSDQRAGDTQPVMVMELGCKDLHSLLQDWVLYGFSSRSSESIALNFAIQVAAATARLHEQGLVDGDIALPNFVLSHRGAVRLVDLGLSFEENLLSQQELTDKLKVLFRHVGTRHYCPPEQRILGGGIQSQAGDIYRLGVCLYKITTGKLIGEDPSWFSAESQKDFEKIMTACVPPPAEKCPPLFSSLVERCLHPRAEKRPTAEQLLQELFELTLKRLPKEAKPTAAFRQVAFPGVPQ